MDQHPIDERIAGTAIFKLRRQPAEPRTGLETRLFEVAEAAFNVERSDLVAATRGRYEVAFSRQAAMYLARVTLGMTLADVGRLFGRDRTTVSHACRRIEDLRDDPRFDSLLHAMETCVLRPDSPSGSAQR